MRAYVGLIRTRKGFTLIELLVVIAIIGLLATIILSSLSTARAKGRDARRISDIREIQNALELYADACKGYPTAPSVPGAGVSALQTSDNNGCPAGVTFGTFIASIPTDPASGNPYLYTVFGSNSATYSTEVCTKYHLGADLELAQNIGSQTAASSATKCGPSGSGAYTGNMGNGAGTVAISNGDFNPGTITGGWVYDVTP